MAGKQELIEKEKKEQEDTPIPNDDLKNVDEITDNALSPVDGVYYNEVVTFRSGDATPSVGRGNVFRTAGTTAITDFDDGILGQVIYILADDSITITDGAPIVLNGNANYNMTATDTLTLCMFNDQVWSEVARSVN